MGDENSQVGTKWLCFLCGRNVELSVDGMAAEHHARSRHRRGRRGPLDEQCPGGGRSPEAPGEAAKRSEAAKRLTAAAKQANRANRAIRSEAAKRVAAAKRLLMAGQRRRPTR